VSGYAERTKRPPRTLTDAERDKLLKVSGAKRDDFRDHVIFSLALGTALREMEIVGLDVGDVTDDAWAGRVKRMIQLRVFANKGGRRRRPRRRESAAARERREKAARARASEHAKAQRVHLPDGTFYKLEKYVRTTFRDRGHKPMPTTPLFQSRLGRRLSVRRLREIFAEWQQRAGFDNTYTFHELRHTAITNVYRETRDIRIAQRVARHADIESTTRYEHASDQEVASAVRGLAS
jgi:integrase/recombinase XerC